MAHDDRVATALGAVGTAFWCIQLIPQIIHNWRRKDTTGLPVTMMFLWAASGVPFSIYFIVQDANISLRIQPQLFTFFCIISLWQTIYYPPRQVGWVKATLAAGLQVVVSAGIEVACILPLRHLYRKGTTWPNLIPGIIAAVLLAIGLIPPYPELWKRRGQVVGINFIFLTMDSLGAIFSILSVAFEPGKVDILGLVLYIIVLVLELGIFASHAIWAIRVRYFGLEPVVLESDVAASMAAAGLETTLDTHDTNLETCSDEEAQLKTEDVKQASLFSRVFGSST